MAHLKKWPLVLEKLSQQQCDQIGRFLSGHTAQQFDLVSGKLFSFVRCRRCCCNQIKVNKREREQQFTRLIVCDNNNQRETYS